MKNYKEYPHNPPHLFRNNTKYFITASTYKKIPYFKTDKAKEKLIDSLFKEFSRYNWLIEDWVVLDNHYHLMNYSKDNADKLGDIMREIHKFTSIWIKKNNAQAQLAEKIWYNYWDTCISYESSYFSRINYIWFNPVKHGYVDDPINWKFGSYYLRFKDNPENIKEIVSKYPCDKLDLD
jgi:putative transposase